MPDGAVTNPLAHNPLRSSARTLSVLPDVKLVDVPKAPVETHEKRAPRRSYLVPAPAAPEIPTPGKPKKITVERTVREPEHDDEPAEAAAPKASMPRWGR